ncbi:MAG: nucleotidyltransferase substrate binding protein [Desulfobacteraceae bacterium]|nr:nucleotidyltransferase substrate binding protein [Desulfobacteraceae bacterium]
MDNGQDIRWRQRFSNYQKALAQLANAVELSQRRPLSELEQQGLVQAFEYTYEMAWNTMRDYLIHQGISDLVGSRDTIRESFSQGLIIDGEGWMDMLVDRNRSSHTYNLAVAETIVANILTRYFPLFLELKIRLQNLP